jgi:hypothetical protein
MSTDLGFCAVFGLNFTYPFTFFSIVRDIVSGHDDIVSGHDNTTVSLSEMQTTHLIPLI